MKTMVANRMGKLMIAAMVSLLLAFGVVAAEPIAFGDDAAHQAQASQVRNFKFTHSAYLTKGKGAAYKSYSSFPVKVAIVHSAKIKEHKKGDYLVVTGTISINGKIKSVKNTMFKLTKKTKYYKHVGNGSYYDNLTKAKMKKLLAKKQANVGGDISFIVKKGKVTVLAAQ